MANILTIPVMLSAFASFSVENPTQISFPVPPPASAPAYAPAETGERGERRELTVLTYNVHGLPWPIAKGRKQAFRAIGQELGKLRREGRAPDIVLIQEGFEDIEELVRLSGYHYWARGPQKGDRPSAAETPDAGRFMPAEYRATGEGWGKFTSAGLHVLSDFPVMETESAPYAYCAGWDCLANKGVMMVHIDVPGMPHGLDVANTHLNSREAAKVPFARSGAAHHLQVEEMTSFIERSRTPGAALLVGGDFNTRDAPDLYYYKADARPFTVVSEFCRRSDSGCRSELPAGGPEPWLASEDLQAFAPSGAVAVRPLDDRTIFDGGSSGARLSDHDGYQVRYELSWAPVRPQPSQSLQASLAP